MFVDMTAVFISIACDFCFAFRSRLFPTVAQSTGHIDRENSNMLLSIRDDDEDMEEEEKEEKGEAMVERSSATSSIVRNGFSYYYFYQITERIEIVALAR